jgi:hypothetical protein
VAWASWRSWTTGELVTAAMMNDQIHDAHLDTTYVPVLTASTTNPTLGTGTGLVQTGSYVTAGKLVVGWAKIAFGTTGANRGSGLYLVSLPVAIETGAFVASSLETVDSTTANFYGALTFGTATTCYLTLNHDDALVADTVPFTWGAAGDSIWYGFAYKAAA